MFLLTRVLLGAVVATVISGCGAELPFLNKPGSGTPSTEPTIELPVVAGAKAAAVAFGSEGPQVPSLFRGPDGSWGIAYGSDKLGNKHIYFASSKDGAKWGAATQVQPGPLSDQDPALFADQTGFHVIFSSNRDEATALYVSDRNATGWSPPQKLNLPGGLPVEPSITRTSHGWALAYRCTSGIVVAESGDGHNWYEARVAGTHLGDPAIAYVDGKLLVVAHRSQQLFQISRGATGAWTQAVSLGFDGLARQPSVAINPEGEPVLAFSYRPGAVDERPMQIALSTLTDGKWTPPEALTSATGDNVNPSLQISSDGGRSLAWGIYGSAGERGVVFANLGVPQVAAQASTLYGSHKTRASVGMR